MGFISALFLIWNFNHFYPNYTGLHTQASIAGPPDYRWRVFSLQWDFFFCCALPFCTTSKTPKDPEKHCCVKQKSQKKEEKKLLRRIALWTTTWLSGAYCASAFWRNFVTFAREEAGRGPRTKGAVDNGGDIVGRAQTAHLKWAAGQLSREERY